MRHNVTVPLLSFAFVLILASCSNQKDNVVAATSTRGVATRLNGAPIVFMSDYGPNNPAVAICKGSILTVLPSAQIVDLTHQVTTYSRYEAAQVLSDTAHAYPPGTVFLAVVDPGVIGKTKAIVVKSKKGHYFVLPDNGLISLVLDRDGIEEAREIQNSKWITITKNANSALGRDIYCPVAARLASFVNWTSVGNPMEKVFRLEKEVVEVTANGIEGLVSWVDPTFGNVVTNIGDKEFSRYGYKIGEHVAITLNGRKTEVQYARNFEDVGLQAPMLQFNRDGKVTLAINHGNFAETYKVAPLMQVSIHPKTRQVSSQKKSNR